jgi:hypothetical protein
LVPAGAFRQAFGALEPAVEAPDADPLLPDAEEDAPEPLDADPLGELALPDADPLAEPLADPLGELALPDADPLGELALPDDPPDDADDPCPALDPLCVPAPALHPASTMAAAADAATRIRNPFRLIKTSFRRRPVGPMGLP